MRVHLRPLRRLELLLKGSFKAAVKFPEGLYLQGLKGSCVRFPKEVSEVICKGFSGLGFGRLGVRLGSASGSRKCRFSIGFRALETQTLPR